MKLTTPVITHWGNWDTLLVRIGQHLWKWHKRDRANKAFAAALEDVWAAKREFRRPMRAKREKIALELDKPCSKSISGRHC
jgi:hypothetical protein